MQLTPLSPAQQTRAVNALSNGVSHDPLARRALRLISAGTPDIPNGEPEARARVVRLIDTFGVTMIDEAPQDAFSWDGQAIRTRSEPCVVVHELAHWQLCPKKRLCLPDFGLGAGPETGRVDAANAATCVDKETQIREEGLASILGILWECHLGIGGLASFAEQNWLEGADKPGTARAFAGTVADLAQLGLIDSTTAHPRMGTSVHRELYAASASA